MTTVPLETPGADEADLKVALGALVGMELLSATQITTPVESVDLTLPAGYNFFRLLIDFQFSTDEPLNLALSYNGGITYLCDPDNGDTYYCTKFRIYSTELGTDAANVGSYVDRDMYLGFPYCSSEVELSPGSAGMAATASVKVREFSYGTWSNYLQTYHSTLNGRANALRIYPGYQGANALDPLLSINSGYVYLYGVPAP